MNRLGNKTRSPGPLAINASFVINNHVYLVIKFRVFLLLEITKMVVGNEMEIFITLTKYNTSQWREEGKPLLMVYYLISISSPSHNSVQRIYEECDILIN